MNFKHQPLLTLQEIAALFDLSEAWLRRHQAEIPHYKIHRLLRFDPIEVAEWLQSFRKGGINAEN